ncbi:Carnosine N-methyltransferase-like protein [Drosera capensis]
MTTAGDNEEEQRRRRLEEVLEIKSLKRIINAYFNYPDASEEDVRHYERSFRMLSPEHKAILSHLPQKYKRLRSCIASNTYFIFNMLQAFESPLDMSLDDTCEDERHQHDLEEHHCHGDRGLSSNTDGSISQPLADLVHAHHAGTNELLSPPKRVADTQEEISVASSLDKNCSGSNCHDIQDNSYKERLPEVACSDGNVSSSVLDEVRPLSRLVVPLVDVDKVRCIIRNIVRDWAAEGQAERDQCYKPILEELEGLFPTRSKDSPPTCLVPGAGLGRLALEISRLGMQLWAKSSYQSTCEILFRTLTCTNSSNSTRAAEEWTLYPWIHSNNNSLSDEDQLRPVAIPDILPYSAGITEGFSMCGGDFVEVYTDPSQQGFWDAVVTCFFIDTAHNIVEYIEIIWKILKDGGVWINLGPLLYHFADAYGQENEMSIELSLEDVKNVALHYGFQLEKESIIDTTYTTNPRSMMQGLLIFYVEVSNPKQIMKGCRVGSSHGANPVPTRVVFNCRNSLAADYVGALNKLIHSSILIGTSLHHPLINTDTCPCSIFSSQAAFIGEAKKRPLLGWSSCSLLRKVHFLSTPKTQNPHLGQMGVPLPPCHIPYLVFYDGVNREKNTLCSPFSRDDGLVISIPELEGKEIVACCHGWLVLTNPVTQDTWSLWDPASLQQVKLPQRLQGLDDGSLSCVLTAPPGDESTECIILITRGRTAMFCRPGDSHWTNQSIEFEPRDLAVSKGVIYGLKNGLDMIFTVEIDTASKSIRTTLRDERPAPGVYPLCKFVLYYLVDLCGELLVAFIGFPEYPEGGSQRVESISIQKLDLERMVWVEAESVYDHAIFLGSNCSISCSNPELGGAEKNCLYFTLHDHPYVYCYRMADRSLTTMLPCEKKLYDPWYDPSWVLPYHRSTYNPQSQKVERLKDMIENNRDAKDKEGSCKVVKIWRKDVQLEFGTLLSNFYRLPIDVMGSLGTQLKIMDYLSFRSVCKEFHAASPLPVPIDRRNHTSSSPWFMFFKNDELTCNLVDPIQNSWYLVTIPPELVGGRILFSNKDGAIICKGGTSCHFYHPFTKVTMELPPYDGELQRIASSSIPTSPGSVTIAILNSALHIGIYRRLSTDQEWRFSHLPNEIYFYLGHNSPVFRDGAFYLLDQIGSLGVMKLTDDEPEWEILNRPQGLESIYGTYLVS